MPMVLGALIYIYMLSRSDFVSRILVLLYIIESFDIFAFRCAIIMDWFLSLILNW